MKRNTVNTLLAVSLSLGVGSTVAACGAANSGPAPSVKCTTLEAPKPDVTLDKDPVAGTLNATKKLLVDLMLDRCTAGKRIDAALAAAGSVALTTQVTLTSANPQSYTETLTFRPARGEKPTDTNLTAFTISDAVQDVELKDTTPIEITGTENAAGVWTIANKHYGVGPTYHTDAAADARGIENTLIFAQGFIGDARRAVQPPPTSEPLAPSPHRS